MVRMRQAVALARMTCMITSITKTRMTMTNDRVARAWVTRAGSEEGGVHDGDDDGSDGRA
eukprot:1293779-Pyramimonas_sp.AAC.1